MKVATPSPRAAEEVPETHAAPSKPKHPPYEEKIPVIKTTDSEDEIT